MILPPITLLTAMQRVPFFLIILGSKLRVLCIPETDQFSFQPKATRQHGSSLTGNFKVCQTSLPSNRFRTIKCETKRCAFTFHACSFNTSVILFDEFFTNNESQAGT